MKTLLSIACLALLAALIGEHERLNGVEAEKQQVVDLLMSTRTDLKQEVASCDDYVAKHVQQPLCDKGKAVWSEGIWACEAFIHCPKGQDCVIESGKQASK